MASAALAFRMGRKTIGRLVRGGARVGKKAGKKIATEPATYMAATTAGMGTSRAIKNNKSSNVEADPVESGPPKQYYNQMSGSNNPTIKSQPGPSGSVGMGEKSKYKKCYKMQRDIFKQMENGYETQHAKHRRRT